MINLYSEEKLIQNMKRDRFHKLSCENSLKQINSDTVRVMVLFDSLLQSLIRFRIDEW